MVGSFTKAHAPLINRLRLFSPFQRSNLTASCTLRQAFQQWFRLVVLQNASTGTVAVYEDAIRWWERLSARSDESFVASDPFAAPVIAPPDPPLCDIDDILVAQFAARLRASTYRRSASSRLRPLSPFTITKILRTLRTLLMRLGPRNPWDSRRRNLGLLAEVPHVPVPMMRAAAKRAFTLDQAKAMYASALKMPSIGQHWTPLHYQLFLALAFYTGHRRSTLLLCREKHCIEEQGRMWLDLPAACVPKTGKPRKKLLHPLPATLVRKLWTGCPDALLLPWPCSLSYLRKVHMKIQELAGIPLCDRLSIHAWRRAHAQQMAAVGLDKATKIAQTALDHSDAATTNGFYLNIEAKIISLLPDLSSQPLNSGSTDVR